MLSSVIAGDPSTTVAASWPLFLTELLEDSNIGHRTNAIPMCSMSNGNHMSTKANMKLNNYKFLDT